MKKYLLLATLFMTSHLPVNAATVQPTVQQSVQQPQVANVKSQLNYLLFTPKSYAEKGEPVPLIIFLHGSGERGTDLNKVKAWGPPAIVEKNPDFPFMVASPQSPENEWWHADQLKQMIDQILATHNVDRHRIYLTGLSMGGFGAWDLAIRYPDYFAAIAPICGGGVPLLVGKLKDTPTWAFHGKKDEAVPESYSAAMVAALKAAGGDVKYTVLPEGGHVDAWVFAYSEAGLFDWFLQHRKP